MTARERARLEAIARERAGSADDNGYVIGPDDLIQIRVPDLLDVSAAGLLASTTQSGAFLPVVAPAPVFEQGLRVNAAGKVTLPFIGTLTAEGQTPDVVRGDETPRELVRRARDRFVRSGAQLLGVVINNVGRTWGDPYFVAVYEDSNIGPAEATPEAEKRA